MGGGLTECLLCVYDSVGAGDGAMGERSGSLPKRGRCLGGCFQTPEDSNLTGKGFFQIRTLSTWHVLLHVIITVHLRKALPLPHFTDDTQVTVPGLRTDLSKVRATPWAFVASVESTLHAHRSRLSKQGLAYTWQRPACVEWWVCRGSEWMNGGDGSYKKDVGTRKWNWVGQKDR